MENQEMRNSQPEQANELVKQVQRLSVEISRAQASAERALSQAEQARFEAEIWKEDAPSRQRQRVSCRGGGTFRFLSRPAARSEVEGSRLGQDSTGTGEPLWAISPIAKSYFGSIGSRVRRSYRGIVKEVRRNWRTPGGRTSV